MKKSFRKLIPTFVMLVITAALVGTSTFAWFSMNRTVSVDGMQVDIKSNNTYLLVNTGDNNTAAEIQTAGVTNVALTANAQVYPASPILSDYVSATSETNNGTHKYFASGTTTVTSATAATAANWFTAQNDNPGNSNDSVKNVSTLTAGNFSDYVVKRTAYLTVASGANNANNLTVTGTILPTGLAKATTELAADGKSYYSYNGTSHVFELEAVETGVTNVSNFYEKTAAVGDGNIDISAVKVLVATSDGGFTILSDANNDTPVDIKGSNTALTDSTVLTVDIYIYYDGEASNVYTNNIANLAAAQVELAFTVDAIVA